MKREGELAAVILAAGKGKRMKSDLPKVMHPVGEKPMLEHVVNQARGAGAQRVIAVIGHGREVVIPLLEGLKVDYAIQEEQLGTGHAVQCAEEQLAGFDGQVLVLSGDVPLLRAETIEQVIEYHRKHGAVATVITAHAPDPSGYGRVLRGEEGLVQAIREHKDCTPVELEIDEINSGIYVFDARKLFEALSEVDNNNAQGEYYLPDVFKRYFEQGEPVAAYAGAFEEIHGVNNREDLAEAERIWMQRQTA